VQLPHHQHSEQQCLVLSGQSKQQPKRQSAPQIASALSGLEQPNLEALISAPHC
jgi:hypothetical protein